MYTKSNLHELQDSLRSPVVSICSFSCRFGKHYEKDKYQSWVGENSVYKTTDHDTKPVEKIILLHLVFLVVGMFVCTYVFFLNPRFVSSTGHSGATCRFLDNLEFHPGFTSADLGTTTHIAPKVHRYSSETTSGNQLDQKQLRNKLETGWKRVGNGLETGWKRVGNGLETG